MSLISSQKQKKIDVMRKIMINEIVANKLTKILKMHMHLYTVILAMKKIEIVTCLISLVSSILHQID